MAGVRAGSRLLPAVLAVVIVGLTGIDPKRAVIFEDLARNLAVPHALGMTTVLVVPSRTREVVLDDWEREGQDTLIEEGILPGRFRKE